MLGRLSESKWVYILLSILLAIVFWMYVRAELDPVQPTRLNNVPVVQTGNNVLTRQGLTVSELSGETVNLRIEAPASVLTNLYKNWKDIYVVVDVSKCGAGDNKLAFTVNWPTNVNKDKIVLLESEPDTITVSVEKLYTNTYDVEFLLRGKVADGYQAGTPAINPETVVVSGPVDEVSQVAKVVAILENENLDQRFAGDLPLTLLDAKGEALTDLDVTLDSSSAYVVLPVVVVKEIKLTVNILPGGGATGDNIECKISPETIFVSGAAEDIENLTELSLGSVDLSKVVGSNTFSFPITIDPSLESVSGETTAEVSVTVNGLSTRAFDVSNIEPVNVPNGYVVSSATQIRTVVVRGKEEDLNTIDASQLRIVVDMSDVSTVGTYSILAKVYLDANSSVGVIGEYYIVMNISK